MGQFIIFNYGLDQDADLDTIWEEEVCLYRQMTRDWVHTATVRRHQPVASPQTPKVTAALRQVSVMTARQGACCLCTATCDLLVVR